MRTSLFQRGLGIALALTLVLAAPLTARAEEDLSLVELKQEHVSLEYTEYEYTGEEILPNVTVQVEDTLLTLGKHYSLEYADNAEVGTGKVIVTGIATGGYQGTVEVPFSIVEKPAEPEPAEPEPVALEESHVTLDKTEIPYNGEPVKPAVTVTVDGKTLAAGTDYTLSFEDNDKPGTAYAVVTAVENSGYTGTVRVKFTITDEAKTPRYSITKGNDAKWYQESTKTLSFTASGDYSDFIGVSIDGKRISDSSYTVKKGSTVVTLKSSYLSTLKLGEHTITIHFTDGKAEGSFRVVGGLDPSNPSTGDRIHLWTATLFVSLTGLAGAAFAFRKSTRK
ncbi:MAG: hypothetical protein SOW84_01585 [Candidatus Faecousia sp.]|nr:hypothetical protein [Candidatus Faecousia sp.]